MSRRSKRGRLRVLEALALAFIQHRDGAKRRDCRAFVCELVASTRCGTEGAVRAVLCLRQRARLVSRPFGLSDAVLPQRTARVSRRRRAKRSRDSYVSRDPAKRAAQLANLRTVPPVGPGRPATHGAYASVAVDRLDAKARTIFDALALDAPLRDRGSLPAADTVAVRLLADTLCRLDSIGEYLSAHGWQDEAGNPRSVLEIEARLRSQALEQLRELGMTPKARAALGLDVVRAGAAFDLARHWNGDADGD
jgi:hypothetical protein